MSKAASLMSGGIVVVKGQAAPSSIGQEQGAPTPAASAAPAPVTVEPKSSKANPSVAQAPATPAAPDVTGESYYRATTFKMDRDRWMKLKEASLHFDKKGQVILTEALDLWLEKNVVQR